MRTPCLVVVLTDSSCVNSESLEFQKCTELNSIGRKKSSVGADGGAIGITLDAMKRNAPTDLVFPEDLLRPHLNST